MASESKDGDSSGGEERMEGEAWWALTAEEAMEELGTHPQRGLSAAQVTAARAKAGWNELDHEESKSLFALVLEQFEDVLVRILLLAAVVSFGLAWFEQHDGDAVSITAFVEPFVILLILIINAFVGVFQESNAEQALEALKKLQPETACVVRGGKTITDLPSRDLVPGDLIKLRTGQPVPADCRVVEMHTPNLRLDQSALTGESAPALKNLEEVDEDSDIQGKHCMCFAGTAVFTGSATCVVTGTGMDMEIGEIQKSVQEAEGEPTPLKEKLDEFGTLLTKVIAVICVLVWMINYNNFFDPAHGNWIAGCVYYFKIAVALAVAAIPEGLPTVITTCLALGTKRMAKRNAIVRKLPSVETLGCTSTICSDKTGTLTTNEMVVTTLVYADGDGGLAVHKVTGQSYSPLDGEVKGLGDDGVTEHDAALMDISKVCCLCNDSKLELKEGVFTRFGEPTEAALKVLAEKLGAPGVVADNDAEAVDAVTRYWSDDHPRLETLEFSRGRKSMSVLVGSTAGRTRRATANTLLVKGAPESVLDRCTRIKRNDGRVVALTQEIREELDEQLEYMSSCALRCLAFAVVEDKRTLGDMAHYDPEVDDSVVGGIDDPDKYVQFEDKMTFVGMVGIIDPPRREVKSSIAKCHRAGIRVIVITGDNQKTAEAICKQIGIFRGDVDDDELSSRSFTGRDFFKMPEEHQFEVLKGRDGLVFSRTEPKHKQKLVKMLRELGDVCAMTGDGVNDAPALKQADIGIAMGISGTEVAKQAADMVLADDNFATIVVAVEEGRSIYNNTKAFIRYLISSNIGEVASIFLTAALGMPEGLIPVQLLWVNLVTDGPPATALGFNPADADIMKNPPRSRKDVLINGWVFFRYMVIGMYVGFATVGVFAYWYLWYDWAGDGHPLVEWSQLTNWGECPNWENFAPGCDYFTTGKVTASTLSLSVLVTIEMLNALNALSEDCSLLQMPPWRNMWLLGAMVLSFGLHFLILYVPALASIFSITPLTWNDWKLVLAFSLPVIFIDEILKAVGRSMAAKERAARLGRGDGHEE